jgi:hypothetical protein
MFKVKSTRKTENVEFVSRGFGERTSQYQPIFDALEKMAIGKTMILEIEAGEDGDQKKAFQNVSQAVYQKAARVRKSHPLSKHKCSISIKKTVEGEMAIIKEEPLSEEDLKRRSRRGRKPKSLEEAPVEAPEEVEEELEEDEEYEEEEEEEIDL